MHDIKYFFSIKLIRQSRGGKKKIQGGQITESITEKYYFSKSRGAVVPPGIHCIRPCIQGRIEKDPVFCQIVLLDNVFDNMSL
jgi:hypothetical protein